MSVPNKIFFGIGIQQYDSGSPLPPKTIENIRLLGDTLKTDYGFQEAKYLPNQAATRQSIEVHLQGFKHRLKSEDTLVIYFAGKGFISKQGDNTWITALEEGENPEKDWLHCNRVKEIIQTYTAKQVLLIADVCFDTYSAGDRQAHTNDTAFWVFYPKYPEQHISDSGKHLTGGDWLGHIIDTLKENRHETLSAASWKRQFSTEYAKSVVEVSNIGKTSRDFVFERLSKEKLWQVAHDTDRNKAASSSEKIAAYTHFTKNYPTAKEVRQADGRIAELEKDQIAWDIACQKNDKQAYLTYIQAAQDLEGKGYYIGEALKKLEKLDALVQQIAASTHIVATETPPVQSSFQPPISQSVNDLKKGVIQKIALVSIVGILLGGFIGWLTGSKFTNKSTPLSIDVEKVNTDLDVSIMTIYPSFSPTRNDSLIAVKSDILHCKHLKELLRLRYKVSPLVKDAAALEQLKKGTEQAKSELNQFFIRYPALKLD